MLSLLKFLRSLNSSQAEYQLSLALSFGIISGFLPFFSLINLLVIVVVFSLNIPLGIYAIFTTIFTIVGSFFDPIFHSIGLSLLNNEALVPLWTNLYNNPIFLWLNFNHTITLGSLVSALMLFIPSYFVSKFLFKKYRITFEKLFKNSKYFSWLNPYSKANEDEDNSDKLIRWKGFIFIIAIISIIFAFFIFLFDPLVKFGLEYGLSKASKSTVIINNVNSNLNTIKIDLNDIRIIKNNKENKIDFVNITIDKNHLLHKKLDIVDITIKNINLNKQLSTYKKEEKDSSSDNSSFLDKFKLDLPNINDILNKEDLKSINEAKQIKKRFDNINTKWKDIQKNKIENFSIKEIQDDFNEIKNLSKNIKSAKDVKNILDKSKKLNQKITLLKKEINYLKEESIKDKKILTKDAKSIKTLPLKDYEYLTSKYSLDKNGALNIVSTYISEDLKKYIVMFSKYYNIIKPYLPQSEEDEQIIRKKGKWIKFKETNPYPNFVLQKLTANILYDKFDSCNIYASHFNNTKINIDISNYKNDKIKLDNKLKLSNNKIDIMSKTAITKFDLLDTNIQANFKNTTFDFKNNNNKSEKVVKNILNNINSFYVKSDIKASMKDIKNMSISINSDLDKKISNGFKTQANKELKKYKQKLKIALNDKIKSKIGNIDQKDLDRYIKLLKDKDNLIQNIKKELLSKYNNKAISNKLKSKAKAKIKDKVQDKLKNKLKSFF